MPEPSQPFLQLDPHMRRIGLFIGYMVIAAGVIVALTLVWPVIATIFRALSPFIVALIVAYLFNPVVGFVERRLRLTRIGGVIVVNLLILLIVAGFFAIVLPILSAQVRSAYKGTKDFLVQDAAPWAYRQVTPEESVRNARREAITKELAAWAADRGIDAGDAPFAGLDDAADAAIEARAPDSAPVERADLDRIASQWLTSVPDLPDEYAEQLRPLAVEWLSAGYMPVEEIDVGMLIGGRVKQWFAEQDLTLQRLLKDTLGDPQAREAAASVATEGVGVIGKVASAVGRAVGAIVSSVMFLVFAGLVSFYLLIDFASLRGVLEILCPDKYEPRFFDVLKKVDVAVGGFIRGQVISAVFVGLLTFVGLMILGLKQYALLIGCVAAVGNLIPYLGPVMGATPAVIYMLVTKDPLQAKLISSLLVVGLFSAIQMIDGFVFQPKIVGQNAQLHPIVVMAALVLGGQIGLVGMIIAVPAACIGRVLLKEFYWDPLETEWRRTTGKKRLDDPAAGPPAEKKDS